MPARRQYSNFQLTSSSLNTVKGKIFMYSWFFLTCVPVFLEIYFLFPNIYTLTQFYSWYIVVPNILVVVPNTLKPVKEDFHWTLEFMVDDNSNTSPANKKFSNYFKPVREPVNNTSDGILRISCSNLRSETRTKWKLVSYQDIAPKFSFVTLITFFVCIHWFLPIIRVIYRLVSKVNLSVSFSTILLEIACYVAFCTFFVAVIGTSLHPNSCVSWWAFGIHAGEIFQRQTGYWFVNGLAAAFFLALSVLIAVLRKGVIYYFKQIYRLFTRRRIDEDCFGCCTYASTLNPIWPIVIFFFGSAFVPSICVLIVGLPQPWIIMIWLYIMLLFIEGGISNVIIDEEQRNTFPFSRSTSHTRYLYISDPNILEIAQSPENLVQNEENPFQSSINNDESIKKRSSSVINHMYFIPKLSSGTIYQIREPSGDKIVEMKNYSEVFPEKPVIDSTDKEENNISFLIEKFTKIEKDMLNSTNPPNYVLKNVQSVPSQFDISKELKVEDNSDLTTKSKTLNPKKQNISFYLHPIQTEMSVNDNMICIICLEKKVEIVFIPCSHGISCSSCARSLIKKNVDLYNHHVRLKNSLGYEGLPPKFESLLHCPLCRESIEQVYQFETCEYSDGKAVCIFDVKSMIRSRKWTNQINLS